jgi:hypothetical protein
MDHFDDMQSFFDQVGSAGLSPEELSLEQLTDLLADAGIDPSHLSDDQLNQLLGNYSNADAGVPEVTGSAPDTMNDGHGELRFGGYLLRSCHHCFPCHCDSKW